MYCPKCGEKNTDTAAFCAACGDRLPIQALVIQEPAGNLIRSGEELEKMSIIVLALLDIITLGLYPPIWFLTKRKAINRLQSEQKLGVVAPILAIIVLSISLCVSSFLCAAGLAIEGLLENPDEVDSMLTTMTPILCAQILDLVAGVILLFPSFKVRRILDDHFNKQLHRGISFSRLWTFFFQIYYLQYKINRL